MNKFTRKDFLETLFQDYFRSKEGFIAVKSLKNLDKRIGTRYFPNTELLSKEIYSSDQHVFFGCCPRESMKQDRQHVRYLVALWAGLDLGPEGYSGKQIYFFGHPQAAKAVRSFPLPPSIVVESGWGLHLYWLLREVTPIKDGAGIETLLTKINNYFQCKSPVDLNAFLRLPDTVNGKIPSHVVTCQVKYINSDFQYDLEDFENLNLGGAAQTTKTSAYVRGAITPMMADIAKAESESSYYDGVDESLSKTPEAEDDNGDYLNSHEDFEPVPYEIDETATEVGLDIQMAERIAERVADIIVDRLTDTLAEAISERLFQKLRRDTAKK